MKNIKEWLKAHSGLAAGAAVIVLALAAFKLAFNAGTIEGPKLPPPMARYYFDLNTREIFQAPDAAPPINAPSGLHEGRPAGVRAYVFSCTDCADEDSHFTGYLETLSPEFREKLAPDVVRNWYTNLDNGDIAGRDAATLVSHVNELNWVATASPAGQEVAAGPQQQCSEGQPLRMCDPASAAP